MKYWLFIAWAISLLLAFGAGHTLFHSKNAPRPDHLRRKRRMKRWPLYTVSALSVALVGFRMRWPSQLDSSGLVLLGIATVAILVAILPIKKIKLWEFDNSKRGCIRTVA